MNAKQIANTPVIRGSLINILARFGISANLYKNTATIYDEVYGIHAGNNVVEGTEPIVVKILLPINPYMPIDDTYISVFGSSYTYTLDENVENGDTIELIRSDSTILKLKVTGLVSFGLERFIATKFHLIPLGE